MTISRPEFPSPVIILDDFLPDADAGTCLQECIDLKPVFMPAAVGNRSESRINTKLRRNEVVYLDTVFRPAPSRSAILSIVKSRISDKECRPIWQHGDLIFDIINYCTWRESVLSRYGKCDFYGRHRDTSENRDHPEDITRRLVTLIYYMNRVPEQFTGGGLTLYRSGKRLSVDSRHNRAVVFPSSTLHEVMKVHLPDERWDSGRFSLNHWMGFKS